MPHPSDMSVSEAAAYVAGRPRGLEAFLTALESDARSGMRSLAERARKQKRADRRERNRLLRMLKHERRLWEKGYANVAGVDEVGRGPLAGPVVASAVILPPTARIKGLDDSKALTAESREELYEEIRAKALDISIGSVPPEEIDQINIYQATLKAMRAAISGLETAPDYALIDGNRVPESGCRELAVVGGDAASLSIAAASVVAKVTRDQEMVDWDARYPAYGFTGHKGYASAEHIGALMDQGPCPIHRRSFSTVEDALAARSDTFRQVREEVDSIKRTAELDTYQATLHRKLSELSDEERSDIDNRIDRRRSQLQKPSIAGEEAAEAWLEQSGFLILERNVRFGRGEIDLIAQQGDTIAFVEVKTSETELAKWVTPHKQSRICSAAGTYLDQNPTSLSPRFDVVSVLLGGDVPTVRHYPAAFES